MGRAQDPGAAPQALAPRGEGPSLQHHSRHPGPALVVRHAKRSRTACNGTPLSPGLTPNEPGAPITKASSSSAITTIAIHSRSPITLRAICCCAKLWSLIRNSSPLLPSSGFQRTRASASHSFRQWRSLRLAERLVQLVAPFGLVAAPGHQHRTHQPGNAQQERPP